MCKHQIRILKTVALLLCVAVGAPAWGLGGDFTLPADDGSRYSLSDSRGRVVALSFGYTCCRDVCRTTLATITMALRQLGDTAGEVDELSISVDPERDTLAVLREYTCFFRPSLHGLTGDAEQLKETAGRHRVRCSFFGRDEGERYTLDCSASLYVNDARGRLFSMLPLGARENAMRAALRTARHQSSQTPSPARAE